MSVDAADEGFVSLTDRVRDELIAAGKLTREGAARIEEAMRTMGLGFADAAMRLGLITQANLAEALDAARQTPRWSGEGIVQSALQRVPGARNLPVKYAGSVKVGRSLMVVHEPDSAFSEQIRALRTELLLLNSTALGGNTIAVLSPCGGEGRTQLCAELAIAFSQVGRKTLLVDADLRKPRIQTMFEPTASVGLAQALTHGGAGQLLGVDTLPNLSLLTAGAAMPNPLELLSNGHFQRYMADWRNKYQMVILDTPPITDYADGLAIASSAEQVLVISRADSTPHKEMREMLRRLAATQSRIVGSVINKF
jgi:protein-tyrosine kinase